MRENIVPKKSQESSVGRSINSLEAKKTRESKQTAAEKYAARGTKTKEERMQTSLKLAEKIRARALELQNEERIAAKKRMEDYLASIQNSGVGEIVKPKPVQRQKISLEELDKLVEQETNPEENAASVAKLEERLGRKMTPSYLDAHEAQIARKNERKTKTVESIPATPEKNAITPRNAEIAARAKEIAQKVAARKIQERREAAQKTEQLDAVIESQQEVVLEPIADTVVDETVVGVSKNPKNNNENHVLSYEANGVPLKSVKKKREWTGETSDTSLIKNVEHPAVTAEDLEIDNKKNKEVGEDTVKTIETPVIKIQESFHEDPTLKQLHEEALHELDFLKSFCDTHNVTLEINEETLDIVNYPKLLREDLKRLEQTEDKEVADEFLTLLGIAASSAGAYEFEKDKQIEEQKRKELREKRAQEAAAIPEVNVEEEVLPEAEEVEEAEELEKEPVGASEAVTQKVEQEVSEEDKEILERDLKAAWLVLLRKRRIAKQIDVGGKHLEFDTELPEKFNFSSDGLMPQNAKELFVEAKEKGTEAQLNYLREFFDRTIDFIDMLEKWESLQKGSDDQVQSLSEVGEVKEVVLEEEVEEGEKVEDTKLTRFNKVADIRNEIKKRFPWVKFKNDSVTIKTEPGEMGFADPEAVRGSRVYQEGKDNPRTNEKSLKTLREDLRAALVDYDEKFDDKDYVYPYTINEKALKQFTQKKDFVESDRTEAEVAQKVEELYRKLQTDYKIVRFPQSKAGSAQLERGDLDILNLEELRRMPGYRDLNNKTGETLAELIGEYTQTLAELDGRLKLNKYVKVKEEGETRIVREAEVRFKDRKEQGFRDLLQNNPMGKELKESIESGKLSFMQDYMATGNAKEAAQRAGREITRRLEERKKKGGIFGYVARFARADEEYLKLKEVQKQLNHWEKYLR